jgi:hypothetical protein
MNDTEKNDWREIVNEHTRAIGKLEGALGEMTKQIDHLRRTLDALLLDLAREGRRLSPEKSQDPHRTSPERPIGPAPDD